MPLTQAQIRNKAKGLLENEIGGLRWSVVLGRIRDISPDTPKNSIRGATFSLFRDDDDIVKISRGFYQLRRHHEEAGFQGDPEEVLEVEIETEYHAIVKLRESDFYKPFADWLRDDLNEVTEAVELGGSLFRNKWGTPDVIGVLKPLAANLIKFEPRIVSAEIKIDPAQSVTAFGQAAAYRLFSHKSYIVVPNTMQAPDLDRLIALCGIYGIGLVTFDLDPEEPNFMVRVNALAAQPDVAFVNDMADQFSMGARKQFNRLF